MEEVLFPHSEMVCEGMIRIIAALYLKNFLIILGDEYFKKIWYEID